MTRTNSSIGRLLFFRKNNSLPIVFQFLFLQDQNSFDSIIYDLDPGVSVKRLGRILLGSTVSTATGLD